MKTINGIVSKYSRQVRIHKLRKSFPGRDFKTANVNILGRLVYIDLSTGDGGAYKLSGSGIISCNKLASALPEGPVSFEVTDLGRYVTLKYVVPTTTLPASEGFWGRLARRVKCLVS